MVGRIRFKGEDWYDSHEELTEADELAREAYDESGEAHVAQINELCPPLEGMM